MVNNFLDAVTKQLGTKFGSTYHYYVENVEQGIVKPCFTVDLLMPLERSKSAILYDRTMPLVVHYFSNNPTMNKKDCYKIAEELVECLEYLSFDTAVIRGENISWHIVDDVLQVFVTYKFTTKAVKPSDAIMEDLSKTTIGTD